MIYSSDKPGNIFTNVAKQFSSAGIKSQEKNPKDHKQSASFQLVIDFCRPGSPIFF